MQTKVRFERWYLPLAVPLGLGPERSEVRVEDQTLHVKMGWAFEARIPLASIVDARPTDARPLSRGVHHSRGRWLVNGSGQGLVALTIDPAVRAKCCGVSVSVRELWVSVTDPDALIAACSAGRR